MSKSKCIVQLKFINDGLCRVFTDTLDVTLPSLLAKIKVNTRHAPCW